MRTAENTSGSTRPDPASAAVDWSRVDTVLLDMDGTLLDLRYDSVFWQEYLPARYAEHHDVDLDSADALLRELMASSRLRLDYYCFDWWSARTGLDITAMKPELAHLIAWRRDAEAFLADLRAADLRAVIVTNAHPAGYALKHTVTGLGDLVDAVETAHDHDHPKEDQQFWSRVQAELGFDPARCLFVDDNHDVLAAAERFGIAQLRAVRTPDSGRPALADGPWPAIDRFAELGLPIGTDARDPGAGS